MTIYDDSGLLSRFLDPANIPPKVKEYMDRENDILLDNPPKGRLVDFGCGNGRHLKMLADGLEYGLGIDDSRDNIEGAIKNLKKFRNLKVIKEDIVYSRIGQIFDFAICMNNTLGNFYEHEMGLVVQNMKYALIDYGFGIVGLHSPGLVKAKKRWYRNVGLHVNRVTRTYIETEEGFRSYHFTMNAITQLFGEKCVIRDIGGLGYFVMFASAFHTHDLQFSLD